ncbi:MAG: hypothetical protein WC381_05790 [Kiritimatiellia bacterium]|jgi:hypothetical protein
MKTKCLARFRPNANFRDPVQYGLRFQILPDRNALARARDLVMFCRRHKIPAVHLIMNAEEWNCGHMTETEIRKYLGMFRRIVPILRQAGISVNLNPWSTTLHRSRGRRLRAGQRFERMVSPTGKQARAVASFADPRWRKYLAALYGRMAAIGFETLWLEDDFRYHNHDGLDWGGDFSEAMLDRFAKKIGRPVTRAEVVRKVLQPGRPHPWRKQWLALWRECQETCAGEIRDAVAAANPRARLGIMSSGMDAHSAEGRDWQGLFQALATGGRAAHRPNFASYEDATDVISHIHGYAALDIQKRMRPPWVDAHPEIENFPFGRFGKSDATTYFQMAIAKIMGSEGLLLDLHPMTGNSVLEELDVGAMLDKSFSALAWLGRQFPRPLESRGVGVPFKADAAETIRLAGGATYDKLVCATDHPGFVLGRSGIAFQTAMSPDVNVVWGPKAWSFTDAEVIGMLGHGLWLDAEAVEILVQRGFGEYLGLRLKRWLARDSATYTVERVVNAACGVRVGFNASCNNCKRVLVVAPAAGAERWTDVVDCMNKTLGPGLTVFQNELGGRVAVSAFQMHLEWGAWNLNFQRQALVQHLVRRLTRGPAPVMTSGAPHMFPIDLRCGSERKVVVANLCLDPGRVTVAIPGVQRVQAGTVIRPLGKPEPARCRCQRMRGGVLTVTLPSDLPHYGLAVLSVI